MGNMQKVSDQVRELAKHYLYGDYCIRGYQEHCAGYIPVQELGEAATGYEQIGI